MSLPALDLKCPLLKRLLPAALQIDQPREEAGSVYQNLAHAVVQLLVKTWVSQAHAVICDSALGS